MAKSKIEWTGNCGYCDKPNTPEGHDACLGTIPNVMNACCGHGVREQAYIQFEDGSVIRSSKASQYLHNKDHTDTLDALISAKEE